MSSPPVSITNWIASKTPERTGPYGMTKASAPESRGSMASTSGLIIDAVSGKPAGCSPVRSRTSLSAQVAAGIWAETAGYSVAPSRRAASSTSSPWTADQQDH